MFLPLLVVRNWSTYEFIHSTRRTPQYMQGDTKMWDMAGDAFETIEDIGILDIANLSLDEPKMESVLFDEITEDSKDDRDDFTHLDD
ncbi:UNVERIFIED_CONTAM: hypothetical protein Scaly_0984100 [Sesamum calycinum]|uniref:Uncharacterized protein n=1 Tax=Sesamum calycinum TaxID=2727403 RepID=A0AAW2QYD0_9LAMI